MAMAETYVSAGAKLLVADIDETAAAETSKRLGRNGAGVRAKYVDISEEQSVLEMVDFALEHFGKIDILVNNAAIAGGEPGPEDLEKDFWDRIIAVDLTGTFLCSKAVGNHMIKQGHGKIINMASISGLVVQRLTGKHNPAYSVAKAGVIMLTKVLAGEWAKYNITVNAIAPTWFDTQMGMAKKSPEQQIEMLRDIPLGRVGKPEDLAGTALYLASDASNFVTGHTVIIDGGYTVW
jgi:NAD(P)-dependent dehydrogenase (short-subunit alcohol dehydrogenase family)